MKVNYKPLQASNLSVWFCSSICLSGNFFKKHGYNTPSMDLMSCYMARNSLIGAVNWHIRHYLVPTVIYTQLNLVNFSAVERKL